jgi:predicted regulator of Ras-like GTPase activity (Roadblock/LC7/MglB family)
MPVSELTVEAIVAAKPESGITAKPEPGIKPEPVIEPEPAITAKSEPVITSEPDFTPPSPARAPVGLVMAPAATTAPTPTDGAAAILAQFTAMDGVQWAVLADREGFVVEATANAGVDADVAAALSACLAESSDGLGRELGRGTLHGIILEYEKGMVVIYGAGAAGLLAVGLTESSVLGKVRYFAKKALPELTRVL